MPLVEVDDEIAGAELVEFSGGRMVGAAPFVAAGAVAAGQFGRGEERELFLGKDKAGREVAPLEGGLGRKGGDFCFQGGLFRFGRRNNPQCQRGFCKAGEAEQDFLGVGSGLVFVRRKIIGDLDKRMLPALRLDGLVEDLEREGLERCFSGVEGAPRFFLHRDRGEEL